MAANGIIPRHTNPGCLTFYKYHGKGRKADAPQGFRSNIVFTTYATLAAEMSDNQGALNNVAWFRVVLDEGEKREYLM